MRRSVKVRFKFAWYDLWVGAYWDRMEHVLYVCPLPTLVIAFHRCYFCDDCSRRVR